MHSPGSTDTGCIGIVETAGDGAQLDGVVRHCRMRHVARPLGLAEVDGACGPRGPESSVSRGGDSCVIHLTAMEAVNREGLHA